MCHPLPLRSHVPNVPLVRVRVLGFEVDLGDDATRTTFEDAERLVVEGDTGDSVYLLVEGAARVVASGGVTLDVLGPGDLVGELSLLAGGARTATVLADGRVLTARMDRAGLERLLAANPELAARVGNEALRRLDERRLADFVRRMLGSAAIPVAELRPHLTWRWVRAGDALYREGDEGDSGFLVVSGRFVILARDDDSTEGTLVVVGEVGQDQFVGESGIFEGRPRQVTLVATRDSLVVQITRASAMSLLTEHPELFAPALLEISRRSRRGPTANPKRTIALAVTTSLDRSRFGSRLSDEIGRHGTCAHVWSDWIDAHMNQTGFANAEPGGLSESRLSQLLHEVELAHDHAIYETDPVWSAWSERVARQSDRLVAVVSAQPDGDETAQVDRFFGSGAPRAQRVLVMMHPPGTHRPEGTARWVQRWDVDRILHVRAGSVDDMARLGRMMAGRPYGLVLGGGGARGFAHLGVRRAMVELGIPIDMVGGSSIGGALGIGMAMDLSLDEHEAVVARLFSGILDYTIPVVSLVKGERITNSITTGIGGWDFEDLWLPFFCVSTNLTQSREMVHRHGDVVPAIRASVSIPGVMPPVAWGDDLLVDGGVLNNLPADLMRSDVEAGTVVAVDVAPPSGPRARRDIALSVSGWEALRAMAGRGGAAYPGITALLMRTMIAGSIRERSRMLERGDVDLYLDLDLRGVSLLDFEKVPSTVAAGYEAAMPRLEAWLAERDR
jgi:predicted acylesterase/phospholipase RssA/CRP-like cAMP-binding protein